MPVCEMEINVWAPVRVSEASVYEGTERRAWGLLTRQDLGLEGVDDTIAIVRRELLCTGFAHTCLQHMH